MKRFQWLDLKLTYNNVCNKYLIFEIKIKKIITPLVERDFENVIGICFCYYLTKIANVYSAEKYTVCLTILYTPVKSYVVKLP